MEADDVPGARVTRTLSACSVTLLGLGLLTAGVATAGPPCTHTIRNVADARSALTTAVPGDMLCFVGADLSDVDLTMSRSGTASAPISLVSDGKTVVHQLHILADHVTVQGFTIIGGGELLLAGTGITAQKNTIRDTGRGGIICAACTDSIIQSNTVTHVSTTGISITGLRITVRENFVSVVFPGGAGDADGIRFFGNGHQIISNTIQDISLRAGDATSSAHPDCFQTLDAGHPATWGVRIEGNSCQNIQENCLIATGDESGNGDAPAGSRSITFIGNTCRTGGEQSVYLRHWPRVDLSKNKLLGSQLKHGIQITQGSTGCQVRDNTTARGVPAVEVDPSSRQGYNSPF
ncbi:MAG TPA: right-handed parallel beta-helix repeat-containing protein [Pseudonocardiaceae bacterium]